MSTAAAKLLPAAKAAANGQEQRFLVHGVPWDSYVVFGEALLNVPVRLTYSRGSLEFMPTSLEHEEYAHLLVLLMVAWCVESNIKVKGYGRSTLRRRDQDRGMEPDACFYFTNLTRIRGKKRFALPGDPPPELAIEIEVSRSVLDRLEILAAVGVAEVWTFDGTRLRIHRLDASGRSRLHKRSLALPTLPVQELARFVKLGESED